jgi:hypothetical protein
VDVDALAARHDGDVVVGGGASAGLAGGVWRIDLSHTRVNADGVTSLVANFDRSWSPGGRTLYAFGEYFLNGFGLPEDGGSAAVLDPALLERLQRGELFSLGRHELASGVRFDWTPLVTVSPTALVNLTDGSVYALTQVQYDWRQNLTLYAGVQVGLGPHGSEYGGIPIPGFAGDLAPGTRVWLRLARYF